MSNCYSSMKKKDARYLTVPPEQMHQDDFSARVPEEPPDLDGHALAVAGSPQQSELNEWAQGIDGQFNLDCLIYHENNPLTGAETDAEEVAFQYGEGVSPSRTADTRVWDEILEGRDVRKDQFAVLTTSYNTKRTRQEVEHMENAEFHEESVPAEGNGRYREMGSFSWDIPSGAVRSVPLETSVAGIPLGSVASRIAPYTPTKSTSVEETREPEPQYSKSMVLGVHVSETRKELEGRLAAENFKAVVGQDLKDTLKRTAGGHDELSY